jgi:Transposase DDE domain
MHGGYDSHNVHQACAETNCIPIIPMPKRSEKTGKADPPSCDHGPRHPHGMERKRQTLKWRCSQGVCKDIRVRASREQPLIPYKSERWRKLYNRRSAVERENGRLKDDWGLNNVRVRRRERVQLHVDLTILARLTAALVGARHAAAAST